MNKKNVYMLIVVMAVVMLTPTPTRIAKAESYCDPNEPYIDSFSLYFENVAEQKFGEGFFNGYLLGVHIGLLTFKGEFSKPIESMEDYVISFLFEFEGKNIETNEVVEESYNYLINVGQSYHRFNFVYPELIGGSDNDDFGISFYYPDLLDKLQIYQDGYDVTLKHIGIRVTNIKEFTYSYTSQLDFTYYDHPDYADAIKANSRVITSITYSVLNSLTDVLLLSDTKDATSDYGIYLYEQDKTILSEITSNTESATSILIDIIKNVPKMLLDILLGTMNFLVYLPSYISTLVPFLPSYLVSGIVYTIYFGLVISAFRLIRG